MYPGNKDHIIRVYPVNNKTIILHFISAHKFSPKSQIVPHCCIRDKCSCHSYRYSIVWHLSPYPGRTRDTCILVGARFTSTYSMNVCGRLGVSFHLLSYLSSVAKNTWCRSWIIYNNIFYGFIIFRFYLSTYLYVKVCTYYFLFSVINNYNIYQLLVFFFIHAIHNIYVL